MTDAVWFWVENSDGPAVGDPREDVQFAINDPGAVLEVQTVQVIKVDYRAYLPPADDSDSDDEFEVIADSREAAQKIVDDELTRRAKASVTQESAKGKSDGS